MTEVSSPPEYASTTRLGLDIVDRASQQRQDDRLLRVKPILRLVERDRVRRRGSRRCAVSTTRGSGSKPGGHATTIEAPSSAPSWITEWQTLLPSPIHASRIAPKSRPRSQSVKKSASA